MMLRALHELLLRVMHVERRLEPFFRPALNRLTREPVARVAQHFINWRRENEGLGLAEEKVYPWEEESLDGVIREMSEQMRQHFQPGKFERGGNTKTHGIVRATVTVRDDLPTHLRQGIFREVRSYPAYIRYAGPGPDVPADIRDVGFTSMSLKIMDVHGEKNLPDEKFTQDFPAVCTPTFVTPDIRANARLQYWSTRDMPLYYFLDPRNSHVLDFIMQSLWNETQYNPLGQRHYSCTPYLLGEGRAMLYSYLPKSQVHTKIPGVPFGKIPFNYLRDNMVKTLAEKDVEFDFLIQVQTDPHRMPLENAAVRWPEELSPFIPAATIHIPKQTFDSQAQFDFGRRLRINPWQGLKDHRPLGNQNRARLRMYRELSAKRLRENQVEHYEPDGTEEFTDD